MQDAYDVRKEFDPAKEVSDWFWRVIADARRDSSIFTGLTDEELINFANEMLGLKTYFSHAPFHPPDRKTLLISTDGIPGPRNVLWSMGTPLVRTSSTILSGNGN